MEKVIVVHQVWSLHYITDVYNHRRQKEPLRFNHHHRLNIYILSFSGNYASWGGREGGFNLVCMCCIDVNVGTFLFLHWRGRVFYISKFVEKSFACELGELVNNIPFGGKEHMISICSSCSAIIIYVL